MGIFALAARYGENIMDGDERRKVQSQLEAGYPYDGTEADKRAAMLPYLEHIFALNILEDAMDTVVRAAYVRSNPLREPDYSPDAGLKKIKEMASEFFDGCTWKTIEPISNLNPRKRRSAFKIN